MVTYLKQNIKRQVCIRLSVVKLQKNKKDKRFGDITFSIFHFCVIPQRSVSIVVLLPKDFPFPQLIPSQITGLIVSLTLASKNVILT